MSLLRQISEADGQLSEKEEIEIDYIGNLLKVWLSIFFCLASISCFDLDQRALECLLLRSNSSLLADT